MMEFGAATRQEFTPLRIRVDRTALSEALTGALEGEVRFDPAYRAIYSTDGSNYRMEPLGVVVPRTLDDVVKTVAICSERGVPLLSRGGGTSLAGQTCNTAVILDWSRHLTRVLEIDSGRRLARVQPGTILDHLRKAAAPHGLTFGPDPATHDHCTLGGMIGNNSCGVHAQMAGRTADNVSRLEILTYDGARMWVGPTSEEEYRAILHQGGRRAGIYRRLKQLAERYGDEIRRRFPKIPRRVSGYNLDELLPENGFNVARALVGTEGTCVTILEAELQLVHNPPCRNLLVLGYPDVYHAGDHVTQVGDFGPIGLEGIDDRLISYIRRKGERINELTFLPPGGGFLLVEFGGDSMEEADEKAHRLMDALSGRSDAPTMKLLHGEESHAVWRVREAGLGVTAHVPGMKDTWEGWEDSAVPPEKVGTYLRRLRGLFDKFGYECSLYGHFGQGCIHTRIDFDLESSKGIATFRQFIEEASDLVLELGGSLSGEHGDGQSRAELLPKMFGEDLVQAFDEFKDIWDPRGRMNPGKVVHPRSIVGDLRLGPGFRKRTWDPPVHFAYEEDGGSFAQVALRCVGVGTCRRTEGGTMCPSYMVTRDEEHSTRGRARALFEMLQGEIIPATWRNEAVKESLDLCLACKGCKSDCPVNVDMATYKAEFLSHYWDGRLRPLPAYALGLVHRWVRGAALAPELVNFLSRTPPFSQMGKALLGIAGERKVPAFAPITFQRWWKHREPVNPDGPRVLLWPDTFNNHFHPEVAISAVEALEGFGYRVVVPEKPICCGRPLYDYGMIDTARDLLKDVMEQLHGPLSEGIPVVGLEPSCVATFRDELPNLFPDDPMAKRLSESSLSFGSFLQKDTARKLPRLQRRATVHGHCHEKSVLDFKSDVPSLLERMGLEASFPDTGCCGMAGSFGYEKEKYEVSVACGERVLLPAVRSAPRDELVIADGFSCRSQIEDLTGRRALHLAQVVRMAQVEGPGGPLSSPPERTWSGPVLPRRLVNRRRLETSLLLAAVAGGGYLAWRFLRRT